MELETIFKEDSVERLEAYYKKYGFDHSYFYFRQKYDPFEYYCTNYSAPRCSEYIYNTFINKFSFWNIIYLIFFKKLTQSDIEDIIYYKINTVKVA